MKYKTLKTLFQDKPIENIKSYYDLYRLNGKLIKDKKAFKSSLHKIRRIILYYTIIDHKDRIKARKLKDYTKTLRR